MLKPPRTCRGLEVFSEGYEYTVGSVLKTPQARNQTRTRAISTCSGSAIQLYLGFHVRCAAMLQAKLKSRRFCV